MSSHSSPQAPTPGVTLCIIDTQAHDLATRALDICRAGRPFQEVLFISDRPYPGEGARTVLTPSLSGRADYSRFVMKDLLAHIRTSHVLLIQWDGYITTPAAWTDAFLDYDYIGARWGHFHDAHNVGNGGFSLRSRRLLEALQDPDFNEFEPEDLKICRQYRPLLESRYGIRFAPPEVADQFAFETTYPKAPTFGFHGLFNMWQCLSDADIPDFVAAMPRNILGSIQALSLAKNFIDLNRLDAARYLLSARLKAFPADGQCAAMLARTQPAPKAPASRNDPCPCGSGKRYKHCCGAATSTSARAPAGTSEEALQRTMQLHQAGRLAEARKGYEAILAQGPEAMAEHYLGVLDMQEGRPVEGEQRIRAALAIRDDLPDFHNNLGLCLRAQDRLEEAITAYRKALDLNPTYAPAWSNIGLDQHKLGHLNEALDAFDRALALDPNLPQTRFTRSLALLALGDYARGWPEYEWRSRCPEHAGAYRLPVMAAQPKLWRGEPLAGKSLLLIAEQGIGDTLQFIRYLQPLADQGAQISLYGQKPHVVDFLRSAPGLSAIYTGDVTTPIPAHDFICHLLSLPRLSGTRTLQDVPAKVPYLFAPAARRAYWRQRLDTLPASMRVGLSWAGSPGNPDDRNRSCPLAAFAPLFELPGITWVNLQLGAGREQLLTQSNPIIDWGDEQTDYAETAALMAELDLILCVDTSLAHAAGAMGLPVWIMLTHIPDFRWLLDRRDSPWYPSARLFRQPSAGDWTSVIEAIRSELVDAEVRS
jgi:tetratricopeptide (TPR) repeat protein